MKIKFILFVALLISVTTFSQKKWTLKECVEQALNKNISIQQNKLNLEIAKTDVVSAKGNFIPNLNASSNGSFNFGSTFDPVSNNRVSSTTFGSSFGLSSSIAIFNGFSNTNTYKQAKLGVESSKYDLQKIENDISLFVVNGYLNILFAKENLNVAKIQYEISKKQIDVAQNKFDAGIVAKGELLNAKSTAANDLQSVISQENTLNLAFLNLAQSLQVSAIDFDISPIEIDSPSATLLYVNSNVVYEKSLINRPEIERAKLAIENADLGIKIAKSAYLPSLTGYGNISSNYGHRFKLVVPGDFNEYFFKQVLKDNVGYALGVSLNVPIFNGFKTNASVQRSKINKEIFETRLESEKLSLKQTIEQAFLDVKAASKTFEAASMSLKAQEEAFKNAQEKYNYGSMTQFDFDQVRNRLVNAQGAMIRSKYDYVFKTKVLQFYSGELVLE